MTDILLLGGGHTHALALLAFAAAPIKGARLTLISRETTSPYSGMLPGLVAGLYRREELLIALDRLAERAGAHFVEAEILSIDAQAKSVETSRGLFSYDILSIDLGSVPDRRQIAGDLSGDLAPKPLTPFLDQLYELGKAATPLDLAVIGAGPAGVELAAALAVRFRQKSAKIKLVADQTDLLMSLPEGARRHARSSLERHRVELITASVIAARTPDGLALSDGRAIPASHVVWATGAAPGFDFTASGLPLDQRGFVLVRPTLQSTNHDKVFASGDTASFMPPLPKAGVYAVRQAPILAHNLKALVAGEPLQPYRPQTDTLVLLSTADKRAIGARNGLSAEGGWVWWLKDRIDHRFMERFP